MVESSAYLDQVLHTIRRHGMMVQGQRILAAVSGGPDSVCLLSTLLDLGYEVEVGHFDHQTRDGDSGADAAFVRDLAGWFDIPFHLETRPAAAEAARLGLCFEDYARQVRYAFLLSKAAERHCVAIATGHTADDQAETVLMRLLRGTSSRGGSGIPPVMEWCNELTGGQVVRVVRPLIERTRGDVLGYLDAKRFGFRMDVSNWNRRYLRNRIRHELLPLLQRDYNPEVAAALNRFAEILRADNAYLDKLAEDVYSQCVQNGAEIDRAVFASLDVALQRRVLLLAARRAGVDDCPFERLDAAAEFVVSGQTGKLFDMGSGIQLQNARKTAQFLEMWTPEHPEQVALPIPGMVVFEGRRFRARLLDEPPPVHPAQYCHARRQLFDADALGGEVVVRTRRSGDRIAPLGMAGSKTLGDYLTDAGVPVSYRDSLPLVAADEQVVWVAGYAVSRHVAVTDKTRRWAEIEVDDGTAGETAL